MQKDSSILRLAGISGNLEVLEIYLRKNANDEYEFSQLMAKISDGGINSLFSNSMGNPAMVRRLLRKNADGSYEFPDIIAKFSDSDAFLRACTYGLEQVNLLLAKNPDGQYQFQDIINNIATVDNNAFRHACNNGKIDVVNRLLAKNSDGSYEFQAIVDNLTAAQSRVLTECSLYGHVNISNRLTQKNPDGSYEFPDLINAFRNPRIHQRPFSDAKGRNNNQIFNSWLDLNLSETINTVENHYAEYRQYFDAWVDRTIIQLQAEQNNFTAHNPHGVFNVDDDKAQLLFYIARNCARTNNLELLNQLLTIPAVVAKVTDDRNRILREAIRASNEPCANRLLQIPAVYTLAQQNDFHQYYVQNGCHCL